MFRNKYCIVIEVLFIIVLFEKRVQTKQNKLPQEFINFMSSREMRYHHFLWHNIRNSWYDFDKKAQDQIRKLGWAPPRPAYSKSFHFSNEINNSGEDFLYMHRQMLATANKIMKNLNPKIKLEDFKTIPKPGDKTYPVPTGGRNDIYASWKSDDFYWNKIKPAEDKFTDPNYLRTVTLGQLGSQLEFGIHNYLHIRFANTLSAPRPTSSKAFPYIDKKWDDPKYDWLIDTYSSHVNPIFWKIHGWIDDRIEDWRRANNITTIKWKGTWTGGPMSSLDNLIENENQDRVDMSMQNGKNRRIKQKKRQKQNKGHKHSNIDVMEKIIKILLKTGLCFSYCCST